MDKKETTMYTTNNGSEDKSTSSEAADHQQSLWDARAEARLTRKIDLHVIPSVAIIYMFCFLDRANIGNARLAGLEKDLKMTGSDYNILLTAFYVAYIVFELPSNLLCKVVGPGKW